MSTTLALGETGVEISRVGLGGYELGPESREEPDVNRCVAVVEAALEAGVNWLDTSEAYHDRANESLIGEVLRRAGDRLLLATKVAPKPDGSGFRPQELRAACQASLARLGREAIDIYFLHWPDESGVPLEETWGLLGELADDGLVRAIGLSNYSFEEIERCHAQRRVDVIQDGLSLVDRLANRDLFARCVELGIGVVVYEPLGSGALSGRSIEAVRSAWAGYEMWGFYKRLLEGENGERTSALLEEVRSIGDQMGVAVPQLAIAWVLAQKGVTAAIAGSRNPLHVRENAEAAQLDITAVSDELERVISLGPTA